MGNLLRGIKKFMVQQVLNKEDLVEVGKAYMSTKGVDIRDGEETLTITIRKKGGCKDADDGARNNPEI